MKSLIPIFGMLLILAACGANRETIHRVEVIKSDSLILKQETIQREPSRFQLVISDICDTITGKARDFQQTIIQGKDTTRIQVQDGHLVWDIQQIDSIKSVAISEYKSRDVSKKEDKATEVVKFRIPGWIWYSLGLNVLLIGGIGWYMGRKYGFRILIILALISLGSCRPVVYLIDPGCTCQGDESVRWWEGRQLQPLEPQDQLPGIENGILLQEPIPGLIIESYER